jgi:translation initiation factor IF-2
LQAEFQSDKVAKNKADHVELPKNAIADKGIRKQLLLKQQIAPAKKAVVAETPVVETPKAAKRLLKQRQKQLQLKQRLLQLK